MKDSRFREPTVGDPLDSLPRHMFLLAAAPERPTPEVYDVVAERTEGPRVRRHRVIREVASNHLPEPFPLFGDRIIHALSQLLLDLPELRSHTIAAGLPLQLESTTTRFPAKEYETQERKGFRFAKAAPLSSDRCIAAKFQQPGLVRMKRKRELLQPQTHRFPETPRGQLRARSRQRYHPHTAG